MAFSVPCPGCESVYSVGENLVGKTIRCKKCGELIQVSAPTATAKPVARATPVAGKPKPKPTRVLEDDDEDAPPAKPVKRRAAVDDDDDDDDYDTPRKKGGQKQKKGLPILLIGGGVAALLLIGGVVAAVLSMSGGNNEVAQNNQPMNSVPVGQQGLTPRGEQPEPEPEPTPAPKKAPPLATKTTPVSAEEPPAITEAPSANNPATQTTTPPPPPPPMLERSVPDPTSSGLNQRDYMLGRMGPLTIDQVKRASVFFRVESERGAGEGSGWFGLEPGLVWTNAHVLQMKSPGSKEPRKITMYLNAGTPEQREIPHSRIKILAVDRDIDLALLQVVNEKDLPVPLKVKPSEELIPTQGLNTIGYPFGSLPGQIGGRSRREPEVSIRPTAFTAFRRNEFGQVRRVQLEGGANPGNSGGPVVDANGYVCAVIVEGVHGGGGGASGIALTMAVPTEYVFGLLSGRIGDVEYEMPYRDGGKVRIPVKVHCLDPMKRLNEVGLAGWIADVSDKYRLPGPNRPKPEPGDSDYQKVKLKYDQSTQIATGELVMPELSPGRAYWVQPYYSNSSTPEYWLPGTMLPVKGPPVDRTPADLIVRFTPGVQRSITMSNSSDISEYEEGEGESKNERVTLRTTLKATETVFPPDKQQDYAARLRLTFEDIGIKAEMGTAIEEDIIPKQFLNMLNQYAKLAEAIGFARRDGQIFRYQVNTLSIQDPTGKALVTAFATDAMESLQVSSLPLPNRRVNAGEKWEATSNVRLSLAFARVGKTGKPETQVKEYRYQNKLTYTYVGQRERAGKREAVILIEGKVAQAPGSRETATGQMKGMALVDLDGGVVVECDLDNEIELDTSGDGVKKRVSAINKYKLSRGAAAR
jgi:S1-C subfamily serine protease